MSIVLLDIGSGRLTGDKVSSSEKKLKDLKDVFYEEKIRAAMPQDQVIYKVQAYMPVSEGKPGGLFFGNSTIMPGEVGNEYFMTRGHFHALRETAEIYWCLKGEGALILMDEKNNVRFEKMVPGTVHYIPGNTAHRVANIGKEELAFNACWPSDAGHDYNSIAQHGFTSRLMDVDGIPTLIKK